MTDERPAFVDTNVLIYARDDREPHKREQALYLIAELTATDRLRLSTQVLQEFYVTATRKLRPPSTPRQAIAHMDDLAQWPIHQVDPDTIRRAGLLSEEAQLSFWDALIVVSASLSGAETLYTEDLNHGQTILGVRVVNPFAGS
jgi:predicted nucleic acid-binding protein